MPRPKLGTERRAVVEDVPEEPYRVGLRLPAALRHLVHCTFGAPSLRSGRRPPRTSSSTWTSSTSARTCFRVHRRRRECEAHRARRGHSGTDRAVDGTAAARGHAVRQRTATPHSGSGHEVWRSARSSCRGCRHRGRADCTLRALRISANAGTEARNAKRSTPSCGLGSGSHEFSESEGCSCSGAADFSEFPLAYRIRTLQCAGQGRGSLHGRRCGPPEKGRSTGRGAIGRGRGHPC